MRTIVVAYGMHDRAIGVDGGLPWENEMPADMAHFKRVTKDTSVIMGRRTYESLPEQVRPLPNRQNIILSLSAQAIEGVQVARSLDEAYSLAEQTPMVIGGGEVYRQALETVNKVVATEIMVTTPAADTTFPELPLDEWMVSEYTPRLFDEHNRYSHAFVTYLRRNPIQE